MAGLPPIGDRTMRASYERSPRLAAVFAAAGMRRQEPAALLLDSSLDQVPVNTAYKGALAGRFRIMPFADLKVSE